MKFPDMMKLYKGCTFIFILVASSFFGYIGKPTEMGLAILAGAIALAFANIDKIRRFKGAGFEAEMREQLNTIVAKETEPLREEGGLKFNFKGYGTDDATRQVITALGNPKYTWRTIAGIEEGTSLGKQQIMTSINWLVENHLVTEARGQQGKVWGLSPEGRNLLNAILATEKSKSKV
jgi:hypothetical protein